MIASSVLRGIVYWTVDFGQTEGNCKLMNSITIISNQPDVQSLLGGLVLIVNLNWCKAHFAFLPHCPAPLSLLRVPKLVNTACCGGGVRRDKQYSTAAI